MEREVIASVKARQEHQGDLWFPLLSSPCICMQTHAPSPGQGWWGLPPCPHGQLSPSAGQCLQYHHQKGPVADGVEVAPLGGALLPVAAGGMESRTRHYFIGGERAVLSLRPVRKTLSDFN